MSTKPIKKNVKDKATFKFKEKGKKPLNVSGISNFMITGADFDTGRLTELFESQQIVNLEWVNESKAADLPCKLPV